MKKKYLRWSKADGSTKRRVERIVQLGARACRRSVYAKKRDFITEGGSDVR
jgi:hypothetical protein